MGSLKNKMLEDQSEAYVRNRYNHEAAKLRERMRVYAGNPGFVAKLQRELDELKARRKAYLAARKERSNA